MTYHTTQRVIVHPKYQHEEDPKRFDAAIIILKDPIPQYDDKIRPICLPTQVSLAVSVSYPEITCGWLQETQDMGVDVTVAGWGHENDGTSCKTNQKVSNEIPRCQLQSPLTV